MQGFVDALILKNHTVAVAVNARGRIRNHRYKQVLGHDSHEVLVSTSLSQSLTTVCSLAGRCNSLIISSQKLPIQSSDCCVNSGSVFGSHTQFWLCLCSVRRQQKFQDKQSLAKQSLSAALFSVIQSLLWDILYQNRKMDVECFAILALPFFSFG